MKLYYRISDKSYVKPKLIGATKEACLMNFVTAFRSVIFGEEFQKSIQQPTDLPYVPPIIVFADRCERKTTKMIMDAGLPVKNTDLGNAGSLRHVMEIAMTGHNDELVYFCEDDYLHLSHAPHLLEEGIKRADYVSLYDHPDKYTRYYNGGEHCKVFKTATSHWRNTISTCMTFATTIKTLKEDWDVWQKYTDGDHPHDHQIFTELSQKGRRLIIPIPGAACHTDMTFSDKMNQRLIETWAVQLMIRKLDNDLANVDPMIKGLLDLKIEVACAGDDDKWKHLMKLEAIKQKWNIK